MRIPKLIIARFIRIAPKTRLPGASGFATRIVDLIGGK